MRQELIWSVRRARQLAGVAGRESIIPPSEQKVVCELCGDVAQLGERGVRNAKVVGSNPIVSTELTSCHLVVIRLEGGST